jgi:hypothetical protein
LGFATRLGAGAAAIAGTGFGLGAGRFATACVFFAGARRAAFFTGFFAALAIFFTGFLRAAAFRAGTLACLRDGFALAFDFAFFLVAIEDLLANRSE